MNSPRRAQRCVLSQRSALKAEAVTLIGFPRLDLYIPPCSSLLGKLHLILGIVLAAFGEAA